ncbi:CaiB/BaiF CoA transferase family protein [Halovenus salina]|uniref:CaiB/BaiF CoA transferase family protein n=1 Tax=Halovenus salina TaxID=1510225 RepID=A0ABD5W7T7_9EURY|nr:CaiB/BaiF CoA-transferase family protein [Halovenus salina]
MTPQPTADGTEPLEGVTVLDASRVLSGPFCTMQLGDLGADVIKIERPDTGDQTRGWTPPTYGDSEEAAYYLSINRNKRSVTLNLASEEGREVFRDLASEADVLVENFRVGKMAEWGLGYEDLKPDNPDLVYCKISGYGETGPDKHRPAYDLIMQAEGGMMSITGEPDSEPVRVGVAIADIGAGMYATQAILASLFRREFADAGGERIEVSLFDTMVAWQTYMASYYFADGESPGRMGSRHPTITPYQAFPTKDDWVVVACASEHIWPRFCAALDREDLADDDRFVTNEKRVTNREELEAILTAEIEAYTTDEIVEILHDHDVPATAVNDMADVFSHRQVEARNMRRSIDHPTVGEVEMPGTPMNFTGMATAFDQHPPLLGEQTDEILAEFGYSAADIESLHENDIV